MTWRDFYLKVWDLHQIHHTENSYLGRKRDNGSRTYYEKIAHPEEASYSDLVLTWITGGAEGGNCWGGEASHYCVPDGQPEHKLLDALLLELCPEMPYSKFRALQSLLKEDDYTTDGYYGNFESVSVRHIKLTTLFDALEL
ncbi:MAG: hypothetical protein WCY09_10025 [Candidatus Omnitrophota bacterium]